MFTFSYLYCTISEIFHIIFEFLRTTSWFNVLFTYIMQRQQPQWSNLMCFAIWFSPRDVWMHDCFYLEVSDALSIRLRILSKPSSSTYMMDFRCMLYNLQANAQFDKVLQSFVIYLICSHDINEHQLVFVLQLHELCVLGVS